MTPAPFPALLPAASTLSELTRSTATLTAAAFRAAVGGWALLGPQPSDEGDEWSFRTLSARKVLDVSREREVLLDDGYAVLVLRKARPGPFASTFLIGRAATNDVCITHSSISKLHARARQVGDQMVFSDADSSNGTTVNGRRLALAEERGCASGAALAFGACGFQLFEPLHLFDILSRFREM